jgi:hypothetical protein
MSLKTLNFVVEFHHCHQHCYPEMGPFCSLQQHHVVPLCDLKNLQVIDPIDLDLPNLLDLMIIDLIDLIFDYLLHINLKRVERKRVTKFYVSLQFSLSPLS